MSDLPSPIMAVFEEWINGAAGKAAMEDALTIAQKFLADSRREGTIVAVAMIEDPVARLAMAKALREAARTGAKVRWPREDREVDVTSYDSGGVRQSASEREIAEIMDAED